MTMSDDNREKLQAMQCNYSRIRTWKLELLSDATTIDSALNYIRTKQGQQYKKEGIVDDDKDNNGKDELTTPTAAGRQSVFWFDLISYALRQQKT